ncbi:Stamen-specific protein FIL1 [Heracleum sosnowskyi]|uniref:Stamen-specific protein FIL1 n=1 Tax=Heracleum sosnowskyi TaxID=360622 RepID=A0AAD8H7L7_9APIA|nr:Stamen-specific protein FIL1 [Heracleum sosnowskyi]
MGTATQYFLSRNSGIRMVLVVVMIAVLLQISDHQVQAQGAICSGTISDLNVCASFVGPGATNTNPSADCCATVQSIDHDCYCNTLRIASQIPTQCNLPPLSCSGN